MFWTLLLCLTSVWGQSGLKSTVFSAEEGENITIQLIEPNHSDLSGLLMDCRLLTEPEKKLLFVIRGEEITEDQDTQVRGRVQFDREALKQGQVQLLLTRLSALDSGKYHCAMVANYDQDRGRWGFSSTVYFEIKVSSNRRSTPAPTQPGSRQVVEKRPRAAGIGEREDRAVFFFHIVMVGFIIVTPAVLICGVLIQSCRSPKEQGDTAPLNECPAV